MAARTMLVSADQELARMLESPSVRLTTVSVSGLDEALAGPMALQLDVIVLDLRDGGSLPAPIALYKRAHPSTAVVMITSTLDAAVMLRAMRAGVNECVTAPFSRSDLEEAIDRVTARVPPTTTAAAGDLYAFIGATGGIGTTTMAVNVATALAQEAPGNTLFIDLHLSYGDAADFFAVRPRFSVIDALENASRLDKTVFGGLIASSKTGVDVMASAGRPVGSIDATQVRAVLSFALRHYRYTVLDVPRSDAPLLDALEEVRKIVLVANQQVMSIKNGSRLLTMLRHRYNEARLMVALTRYDPKAEIGQDDVERVFGVSVAHTVPNDYLVALQALNRGRPLLLDNHSSLADSYQCMARDLRGEADRPKRARGFFQSLTGRRTSVRCHCGGISPMELAVAERQDTAQPERRPQYQQLKSHIHRELLNRLNLERLTTIRREDAEPEIRDLTISILEQETLSIPLSLFERDALIEDIQNELFGLGPLEELLHDPSISDILVNRFDEVYVERDGKLEPTDVVFIDDAHVMRIIERIVSSVGRRIDESSPMVDARLQDGSRVNAIIPPLALDGPVLSIRRFQTERLGSDDLVERESLTRHMLEFLKAAVTSRLNIIISGGTGAGKTTLLNILSGFISNAERIITIEDAAELQLRQRHVVRLESRPANIDNKGAIHSRHLVINALRMRPDRIIVGEVLGAEALDMLQAMNTGHDGSLTTIHANSRRDALARLDTMVAMSEATLPDKAVRQQVASAIDLIIQVNRLSDGTRKVTAISEVTGMEQDVISMHDRFVFERTGLNAAQVVCGQFRSTGIRPRCASELRTAGFEMPPEFFDDVQIVPSDEAAEDHHG